MMMPMTVHSIQVKPLIDYFEKVFGDNLVSVDLHFSVKDVITARVVRQLDENTCTTIYNLLSEAETTWKGDES